MKRDIHGFGYFCWKPALIKALLENTIPENSILVYCDSGTELVTNAFAKKRMLRLISKLDDQPILAFQTKFPEFMYTKSLCLPLLENIEQRRTNQIEATTIILRNCEEVRLFVSKWYEFSLKNNFAYINNVEGLEMEGFIEHRWDQSLFSIFYKNSGYAALQMRQVLGYVHQESHLSFFRRSCFNSFFLWQIRNRSGESFLTKWQKNNLISFLILPLQYLIGPSDYFSFVARSLKYKLLK